MMRVNFLLVYLLTKAWNLQNTYNTSSFVYKGKPLSALSEH